jgi:hypothetical protein
VRGPVRVVMVVVEAAATTEKMGMVPPRGSVSEGGVLSFHIEGQQG